LLVSEVVTLESKSMLKGL